MSRKLICPLFLGLLLIGCQSSDIEEKRSTQKPLIMVSQTDEEYTSIFDEESSVQDQEKYRAYFYDSRGSRYLTGKTAGNHLDTSVRKLVDTALNQALTRFRYRPEAINIALEVNAPYEYKSDVLFAAEEYIVQSPDLMIQAQAEETQEVIGKILKRELDPFYDDNSGQFDDTARASDLILYLLVIHRDGEILIKSSVLSKAGQILGVKSTRIHSVGQILTVGDFVRVTVPLNVNGSRTFELMRSAVSQEQLHGVGSRTVSASDISLEQANAYCTCNDMLLTSPYLFEFARREGEFNRPGGIVHEELIAALDSEDADADFYRPGDYLELANDDQSNHFLVFDWNSETYTIVANSYTSKKMTFRCYKPL